MADQDLNPKVALLRHKLALLIGSNNCPIYGTVIAQHPKALEEPWSATMSGPYKLVVFNNSTFSMLQVTTHSEAYGRSFQPDPIECGENIKLYLNDQLFRDARRGRTMSWAKLQRSEGMAGRAVKSTWYLELTTWVDRINGGPGRMSRDGRMNEKEAIESKSSILVD